MLRRKYPLEPDDFPLTADGSRINTSGGRTIATAETAALAGMIADRLNEAEDRREEDRWQA